MMNRTALVTAVAALAIITSAPRAASAAIATEVTAAGSWTQVLEDFNDGAVNVTVTGPNDFSSNTEADGLGLFTTLGSSTDPQIIKSQAGLYDVSRTNFYRTRFEQAASATLFQQFPFAPNGATRVDFDTQITLAEQTQAAIDGGSNNGNGIRVDPANGGQAGSHRIDYLFADQYETRGVGEWDETDGTADLQGWTGFNLAGGLSVDETTSSVNGTSGSGTPGDRDAQIRLAGQSIAGSYWNAIELRVKGSGSNTPVQLFWANEDGGFGGPRSITMGAAGGVDVDGDWHIYQIEFAGDANWIGKTITDLRLDPVNGTDAATFSVDYFRLVHIPAPAALPAGLAMIVALAARRRRK